LVNQKEDGAKRGEVSGGDGVTQLNQTKEMQRDMASLKYEI